MYSWVLPAPLPSRDFVGGTSHSSSPSQGLRRHRTFCSVSLSAQDVFFLGVMKGDYDCSKKRVSLATAVPLNNEQLLAPALGSQVDIGHVVSSGLMIPDGTNAPLPSMPWACLVGERGDRAGLVDLVVHRGCAPPGAASMPSPSRAADAGDDLRDWVRRVRSATRGTHVTPRAWWGRPPANVDPPGPSPVITACCCRTRPSASPTT